MIYKINTLPPPSFVGEKFLDYFCICHPYDAERFYIKQAFIDKLPYTKIVPGPIYHLDLSFFTDRSNLLVVYPPGPDFGTRYLARRSFVIDDLSKPWLSKL